jgi:cytosine deaminase
VTTDAARLMNLTDYGIAVGNPADLLVLDCESGFSAVAELVRPLTGFKAGRKAFEVGRARLCPPLHP